jgi:sugar/nucleoside kinase (ribokinase family)
MKLRSISFAAFCNPLMDVLAHVGSRLLQTIGAQAGTMNLVEFEKAEGILRAIKSEYPSPPVMPGGSGANTARGFSWLNRDAQLPPPLFFGAVGDDEMGRQYREKLEQAGVRSGLATKRERTGFSVIAITPDGERTMFTHLGACRLFEEPDVDFSRIAEAGVLHLTGYMWDTDNQRRVAERAAAAALTSKTIVSLDLADPFVVSRYREALLEWVPRHVNLLFGNREEFALLCGTRENDEDILARAREFASLVVMKVGERGAYVAEGGRTTLCPGMKVPVRDTTGAGDSFAGAFLYGYLQGRSPVACARLGNRLAAAIVAVEGCDYGALSYGDFSRNLE